MQLPFFYEENIEHSEYLILSENTSRHVVQVLRMQEGEQIQITNGKGYTITASIIRPHKKNTEVKVIDQQQFDPPSYKIQIGVSLIKNVNRFEWFLEKATEIGVTHITPLICQRTEKTNFKEERWKQILISAMLQSRQHWCPILENPLSFHSFIHQSFTGKKFIAHCLENEKKQLKEFSFEDHNRTILIGPEGDFTPAEIEEALLQQFIPISLGNTRLRTETAAMVAAVLLTHS